MAIRQTVDFLSRKIDLLLVYLGRFSSSFHLFGAVAVHLWVPILSGIISFVLFSLVDQTKEIYRSLILEKNSAQVVWATFNVFWLSFLTWQSARLLAKQYFRSKEKSIAEINYLLYIPRFIGVFPLAGLFLGIVYSSFENLEYFSVAWIGACLLLTVGLLCFYFKRLTLLKYIEKLRPPARGSNQRSTVSEGNDGLFTDFSENLLVNISLGWLAILAIPIISAISGQWSLGMIVVSFLVIISNILFICTRARKQSLYYFLILNIAVSIGSMYLPPLLMPELFGSISIASIAISSLTVLFSTVYNWGFKRVPQIPAILLIAVLAIAFSFSGWNDNHQIRYLQANDNSSADIIKLCSTVNDKSTLTLEDGFKCWFNNRKDQEYFKSKGLDYPVYIVSSQGGGIYAAYHSATALSKLSDTIPNFSDHVFAISSVSGGSIGSSIYSALVKNAEDRSNNLAVNTPTKESCKDLPLCTKASEIISHDFLSPLFALGLFPDILQRFIPFSINDWDRSRGLEVALEESWRQAFGEKNNILAQSYYQLWHPQKQAPALVVNTTTVETGERLLFSPFTIPYSSSKTMLDFKAERPNIPLSTAVGVSARFPLISSAGWFTHTEDGKTYKNRLVDGGYYDNSGLVTARDIVSALSVLQENSNKSVLDELNDANKIKPKLINLAVVDAPQPYRIAGSASLGLDGIISPVKTVLNVRNTRGSGVVAQAAYDLNRNIKKPEDYRFRALYLDKEIAKLPLGWLLSETSRQKIDLQSPSYRACEKLDDMVQLISELPQKIDVIKNNSCVAKAIFLELNPKN
jgi:hypothetical protein